MEVSIKVSSVTTQERLRTKIKSSEVFMGDLNTEIHKNAELKVVNVTAIDVPVAVNMGESMFATSTHINNDFSGRSTNVSLNKIILIFWNRC